MCFAPQRHTLFRHRNFQKWSEHGVFLYILTWKCGFAPQRRALFSTSQLPKVVRTWCVLYILTWKCASRHNGVHFFDIATSKSGPTLVCFVHFDFQMCFAPQPACTFSSRIWPAGSAPAALARPTFRPSGAPNHWKNTVFRDFPTFSRICLFFLLILSLLTLPHLCFSTVHIVGSFHTLNFLRLLDKISLLVRQHYKGQVGKFRKHQKKR